MPILELGTFIHTLADSRITLFIPHGPGERKQFSYGHMAGRARVVTRAHELAAAGPVAPPRV